MGEGIATQEVFHLQYYDLPTTMILLLEHWTLEHIVSRREVHIMEIGNGTSRCNLLRRWGLIFEGRLSSDELHDGGDESRNEGRLLPVFVLDCVVDP